MIAESRRVDRLGIAALAVLIALLVAVVATWPALPVDETRYLTVAWEMRTSGNWSLPTLNFEPYSHKPPLLFWLINASWSVFGLAVWPARLVGVIAMGATLFLTSGLDRRLASGAPDAPAASALLLLSLPLFVTLGFSIMFDMLLTATVAGAMLALWTAGRGGGRAAFVAYGFCTGLGLLAKGPVVLLFTVPAALAARVWVDRACRRGWYPRIGAALTLGIAMVLAWALRAAYLGGPDYAEMLFWKQSAGRITSSFAHARPFWFYGPILALFLLPLLFWRPAWIGLRDVVNGKSAGRNFLLCWIVPAFLGLSLVSGKQLHYILPIMPALALLISLGLRTATPRSADATPLLLFAGAFMVGLIALTSAGGPMLPHADTLTAILSTLSIPALVAGGLLALAAIAFFGRSARGALMGLAIANMILVLGAAVQSRTAIKDLFDLQPVADVLATWRDKPIAVAQPSRGEFGFLARLTHPVLHVPESELATWLEQNPHGIAISRSLAERDILSEQQNTSILYQRPYRIREVITLSVRAPGPENASFRDRAPTQ